MLSVDWREALECGVEAKALQRLPPILMSPEYFVSLASFS
jgi:hypothetical protein